MKQIKAVVIGLGDRGGIYANYSLVKPEELKIVGVCDTNPFKLEIAKNRFNLSDDCLFANVDDLLNSNLDADLYINATMDEIHYCILTKIIKTGKAVLTEKPIVNNKEQLLELEELANKHGTQVFVGHVLRYTPFYKTIKQLILNNEIGQIRSIEAAEHVGAAHYAGSFIRGRWKSHESCGSSLLLAKSCHDIDIICWLNNESEPISVSSYGGRYYFNKENAPEGSTSFCYNCPHEKNCYFSAIKLYYESNFSAEQTYIKLNKENVTDEDKINFLKTDDFGRCVFKVPNADMEDRQVAIINFKNGSVCSFTLVGGCPEANRTISIIGTKGEIEGKIEDGIIYLKKNKFNSVIPEVTTIDVNKDIHQGGLYGGHNGGDYEIMKSLVAYLNGDRSAVTITKLSDSVNGHLVVYAADESLAKNVVVKVK